MSRPDGKPINYIDSAASNGDSYLTVQAYFHLTNISFTSSTFNVTLECGVNSSGIATGQTASFDNTQSFVNIYVNGNLITVTPAINIPAGYNSYYYISTSGSYTSTTIRFQGTIYGKASGGSAQRNVSTSFDATYDIRTVSNQISIVSSNPGTPAFVILPQNVAGQLYFIKSLRTSPIYVMASGGGVLDGYSSSTITLSPYCCLGAMTDDGTNWWIATYYPNAYGSFFNASSSTQNTITQPITVHVDTGSDYPVNLPNPASFNSRFLVVILSAGVGNNFIYVNNNNGYLNDQKFTNGFKFKVGGFGGGGNKGNASIFLISNGTYWYIAAIQANEYINYYDLNSPTSSMTTGMSFTSNNALVTYLPQFSLAVNSAQLFFLKKKTNNTANYPVIQIPSGWTAFIGSTKNAPNNRSSSIITGGNGDSAYESYFMIQTNTGSGTAYYYIAYYPWTT